jgi:ATP-dependent helicase YprA (DUF1998 family)
MFNPLSATKQIQKSYVNFYKTNFTLGNDKLTEQFDKLSENNRLWREPFIAISQKYISGATLEQLGLEIKLNDELIKSLPIENLFLHQQNAIRNIAHLERNTVVSSGTGSGKTESFLIPVLNECTKSEITGIKAVLIYPMNALANDQVDRLRDILFELNKKRQVSGKREITFGIYTGPTAQRIHGKSGELHSKLINLSYKCPSCKRNDAIKCSEEHGKVILTCKYERELKIKFQIFTREELRNNPPDIMITNYSMLQRIMVNQDDKPLFEKNKIKFLVMDEIHAYGGAKGVDVALLIRRFKRRILKDSFEKQKPICIGTSATMSKAADPQIRKRKIGEFAERLFGDKFTNDDIFEGEKSDWDLPAICNIDKFEILSLPESSEEFTNENFNAVCKQISNESIPDLETSLEKSQFLGKFLLKNPFFQELIKNLSEPKSLKELKLSVLSNTSLHEKLEHSFDDKRLDELIWSYLKAGSLAKTSALKNNEPLLRVGVHNFFRILPKIFMCTNPDCREMYFTPKEDCDKCTKKIEELAVCRNCSAEFHVSQVSLEQIEHEGTQKFEKQRLMQKLSAARARQTPDPKKIEELQKESEEYKNKPIKRYSANDVNQNPEELWYKRIVGELPTQLPGEENPRTFYKKCMDCGSFNLTDKQNCELEVDEGKICNSEKLILVETFPPGTGVRSKTWRPRDCPDCGFAYGGAGYAVTKFEMAPKQASTNLFNIAFEKVDNHKLLIFTDSRQDAAELARWLDFAHEGTAIKQLVVQKLQDLSSSGRNDIGYRELVNDELMRFITNNWYNFNLKDFDRTDEELEKKILLTITDKKRLAIERMGLIECNYTGLKNLQEFEQSWKSALSNYKFERTPAHEILDILNLKTISSELMSNFITTILNMMRRREAIVGLEKRDWNEKFEAEGFDWDAHNAKIISPPGTHIHNLGKLTQNSFLKYALKVFELGDETAESRRDASKILESVWNFVKIRGYLIRVNLEKFKQFDNTLAWVVSTNNLRLSIPKEIQSCDICHEVNGNLPKNNCSTNIRFRLCPGKTKQIPYSEFLLKKQNDHFFMIFKDDTPTRMATKEHTGALSEDEKKFIQDSFSSEDADSRKVDVIVATPTLELGVDIGDLTSVGLYKSPPSAISYTQRVGRAGRRDGISFINTFFFNSPIDEFYFRNPKELIKGDFYPPYINFENDELIKRNFNSIILEELALSKHGEFLNKFASTFLKNRDENMNVILKFVDDEKDLFAESFRFIFNNIPEYKKKFDLTEKINTFTNEFKENFNNALDIFVEEVESAQKSIDGYKSISGRLALEDYIKLRELEKRQNDLNTKKLSTHLFDINFLPRFAFSGKLVQIEDSKGSMYQGGRPRNMALTEFAPNCEITWKKKTFKSIGIDPDKAPEHFSICNHCKKYFSTVPINGTECPYCKNIIQSGPQLRSFSPNRIFIKEKSKSVTESVNYNEPKLDIFMPKPQHEPISKIIPLDSYEIELTKFGNTTMLLTVSEVFTEFDDPEEKSERDRTEIQLCDKCGKVKEFSNEGIGQKRHRPVNQKYVKSLCTGNFKDAGLHNKMPTNIISIKIKNKKENETINDKKFLITLKNAIINAGQTVAEAMEGELEGVIKEDELVLFDNVDGGAGYVDIIYERFNLVLKRAYDILSQEYATYNEVCEKGCLHCLWSYRRKRDIPFIDKHLVYPLLQESSNLLSETSEVKKKPVIFEFEKLTSNLKSLNASEFVKKSFQNATKEIKIFTSTIDDKKIDWESDRAKSWIDILGSLRNGPQNVPVSIYIKNRSIPDEDSLKKLLSFGIEIFEIKDNYFEKSSTYSNDSLVVIDQFSNQMFCMQISSSLTELMIKNHTIIQHSNKEKMVEKIKNELDDISINSKKINENDLTCLDNIKKTFVIAHDKESLSASISEFNNLISSTQKNIKIIDPYLKGNPSYGFENNLQFYISYLIKYLKKGVTIQILSTGHEKSILNNLKTRFEALGYPLDIISYDLTGYYQRTRIIHSRYLIIDDKKSLKLEKGLTMVFEFESKGYLKNGIENEYNSNITAVKEILEKAFHPFWNYETSLDEKIKNGIKTDTRILK